MGNSQNSIQSNTRFRINRHPSQSKKCKKSSKSKRQKNYTPIELDLTNPVSNSESPAMNWNCHRKLENIEKTLIQIGWNPSFSHKNMKDLTHSSSPQSDIRLELECIKNDVSKTIYGITHNCLDEIPNERALLDYFVNTASHFAKTGVIVFEIDDMYKIHDKLGWKSGDNMIKKAGKKIQEYCNWYTSDYNVTFKLFHPDFKLNEFVVITDCSHDKVIEDLCYCALREVSRSVNCYFQPLIMWAGYVTYNKKNRNNQKQNDNDDHKDEDITYQFRRWYEKAQFAMKECMKVSRFSDRISDRVMKWLPKIEREQNGAKITNIIKLYSLSRHSFGNINEDMMKEINKLIKKGADLNQSNTLFEAISIKDEELIRYLVSFEFDADHRNKSGHTPLIYALTQNISESVCILLAKRLRYPNIPDNNDITPSCYALKYGYFKVMDILHRKGSTNYAKELINCCIENDQAELIDIIYTKNFTFSMKLDKSGKTILHYAVMSKAYEIIAYILKNKHIHVDIVDNYGWTGLHIAAAKNHVDIITLLIGYGADIKLKTNENISVFNLAQDYKSKEALQFLYECAIKQLSPSSNSLSRNPGNTLNIIDTDNTQSDNDTSFDNSDGSDINWNKENENMNHAKEIIVNQPKRKSQSESHQTNNSENDKNKQKTTKKVSIINENIIHKLRDDYSEYNSDISEESNESRISQPNTFDKQIQNALLMTNGDNINFEDSNNDDITISDDENVINDWYNDYLDGSPFLDNVAS